MKPGLFAYAAPRSLEEALSLLQEHGDEAKILAGGQSLVPLLNMRLAMPELLVDINNLVDQDVLEDNGGLSIGPLVRQSEIERTPGLPERYPLLADAIRWVGHSQIRNRGTVLGSLAHADPASELPVAFRALDAQMEIASARGSRVVPAQEFFVHIMTTAIEPDEMLVRAFVPSTDPASGASFLEVARRHGDFAVASVAVVVTIDQGACTRARIAMGGVGPVPLRAHRAEDFLVGAPVDVDTFVGAADIAAAEAEPVSDIHGTEEYRRDVVRTLVTRGLAKAAKQAEAQDLLL